MTEKEQNAAANVCKIYFDIASEVLGESEVRRRFKAKLEQALSVEHLAKALNATGKAHVSIITKEPKIKEGKFRV
jgi:hypothetical protein